MKHEPHHVTDLQNERWFRRRGRTAISNTFQLDFRLEFFVWLSTTCSAVYQWWFF